MSEIHDNRREKPKEQGGEPQDSECAKSAPTLKAPRSDTADNPEKSNIQGVGLHTF